MPLQHAVLHTVASSLGRISGASRATGEGEGNREMVSPVTAEGATKNHENILPAVFGEAHWALLSAAATGPRWTQFQSCCSSCIMESSMSASDSSTISVQLDRTATELPWHNKEVPY